MRRIFASSARPSAPWDAYRADDGYGATAQPDWRRVDWVSRLRRIEIGGASLNYVDLGPGVDGLPPAGSARPAERPLVLVHGLGGQWQNWLENIPSAATDRRVIAMDLPGFGLSGMPRGRITIPGYGRCVDELCERLELGRVDMVGNSMGGFIASEVAIQFPARVDRLVLVSAAGISSADVYRAPALLAGRIATVLTSFSAGRHRQMARRPGTRWAALAFVARYPGKLSPDLAYEGYIKGAGKPGFHDAFRACLEYDFRHRLPEIERPTLIVWGENDSIISVRDAHEFERLIPDSRKVVMLETGHIPQSERPEAFNRTLLEFLAEEGPAEEKEAFQGASEIA